MVIDTLLMRGFIPCICVEICECPRMNEEMVPRSELMARNDMLAMGIQANLYQSRAAARFERTIPTPTSKESERGALHESSALHFPCPPNPGRGEFLLYPPYKRQSKGAFTFSELRIGTNFLVIRAN